MPRIKDLTTKTGNLSSADQFVSDNGTLVTKIDYTALAKAIIEQYNGTTLAGSAQSVQAALNSLNSKSMTYTYAETSGSFLTWLISTFTANGSYYVVIATNNTEGLPIAGTGVALVQRRNADIYVQAFVNATGQPSYENRYIANKWTGWVQEPTRTEVAALQAQLVGNVTNTSTFTIYDAGFDALGTAPKIIFLAANAAQANAMSVYGVRTTGNGTLYRTIIFEGTGSSAPRIGTNGEIRLNSTTTPTPVYAWVMNSTPSTPVN